MDKRERDELLQSGSIDNRIYLEELRQKEEKFMPTVESSLRKKIITVPDVIYKASGLLLMRRRIKSLIFTTDISIMRNNNANALMVYPFTPELVITQAAISVANVRSLPVSAAALRQGSVHRHRFPPSSWGGGRGRQQSRPIQ